MSYDVRLVDEKGESVTVPRHEDGGTRIVGGTEKAELNITYNYGGLFRQYFHLSGIKWLHRQTGAETRRRLAWGHYRLLAEEHLRRHIEEATPYTSNDYWEGTPGNAAYALLRLWMWAEQHPTATFEVS